MRLFAIIAGAGFLLVQFGIRTVQAAVREKESELEQLEPAVEEWMWLRVVIVPSRYLDGYWESGERALAGGLGCWHGGEMNFPKLLLLLAVVVLFPMELPAVERPNVILIFTDDQGTIDANCYGATELTTPGMDALARTGVRFSQFYAAAPVCSPSRAGLLTGRYPVRAGVPGNVSSKQGHAGMPAEQWTMAEMFQGAGYRTAHIGKWHLGYTPETMPNGQGFEYSFGHMGGCIDNYSHFFYWAGPNRHDLHRNGLEVYEDGRFFPDLMVEEAGRFMEENREEPFFIYFAMNTPHYPYQGEPEWLEHYAGLEYPRDLYAAFLSTLDARMLALVKKVEALGLRDRTIFVFQSDHGHSTEERAHGGGGSAGPYRGAKFSLFEGGIRVPAIISWPDRLPAGEVRGQLAHSCDWLPTLAELCGIDVGQRDLDGKSLVPVLESPEAASPHGVLHWQVGGGDKAQWAVREGDWKLIGNPRDTGARGTLGADDDLFLANLKMDETESRNLREDHPEQYEAMLKKRQEWEGRGGVME